MYSSTFAREPPPASSAAPPPLAALVRQVVPGGRALLPAYSQGFGGAPVGLTAVFQEVAAASPPGRPSATLANQVWHSGDSKPGWDAKKTGKKR